MVVRHWHTQTVTQPIQYMLGHGLTPFCPHFLYSLSKPNCFWHISSSLMLSCPPSPRPLKANNTSLPRNIYSTKTNHYFSPHKQNQGQTTHSHPTFLGKKNLLQIMHIFLRYPTRFLPLSLPEKKRKHLLSIFHSLVFLNILIEICPRKNKTFIFCQMEIIYFYYLIMLIWMIKLGWSRSRWSRWFFAISLWRIIGHIKTKNEKLILTQNKTLVCCSLQMSS